MMPVNPSSFGLAGGDRRRYPGGAENVHILSTVVRAMPNRRAVSRRLRPSTKSGETLEQVASGDAEADPEKQAGYRRR